MSSKTSLRYSRRIRDGFGFPIHRRCGLWMEEESRVTSDYASLLGGKKILYAPTCILIEILATTYSHTAGLTQNGRTDDRVLGELIFLLARFTNDIRVAILAYEVRGVGMFAGDWMEDRKRAALIFSGLIERLYEFYGRYAGKHRLRLRRMLREIHAEWSRLCRLLDLRSDRTCNRTPAYFFRYFHGNDPRSWRRTMAFIILEMAAAHSRELEKDKDCHLLLLCFARMRTLLIGKIEEIERKNSLRPKFDPSKILCVSSGDVRVCCPNCIMFSQDIAKHRGRTTRIVRQK